MLRIIRYGAVLKNDAQPLPVHQSVLLIAISSVLLWAAVISLTAALWRPF